MTANEQKDRPAPVPPSQRPGLLKLLARDEVAQRLIAAWPNVDHSGAREAVIERWSLMANVRPLEILKKWPMLFGNGFLTEAGRVDELTDRYVQSVTIAGMPASMRPKAKAASEVKTPKETP